MYDNICKYLVQAFSTDFVAWLLGEPVALVELKLTAIEDRSDAGVGYLLGY